jgi:hypothetical protein
LDAIYGQNLFGVKFKLINDRLCKWLFIDIFCEILSDIFIGRKDNGRKLLPEKAKNIKLIHLEQV